MWVRPLCNIASWIKVWLPWVTDSIATRHQVGWRNATLLHPRVHSSKAIHVASHRRPLMCSCLGAAMLGSSIMTVQVQNFFWAFRLLQVFFTYSFCWTADSTAAASNEPLSRVTCSITWTSRMRSGFRQMTR